MINGIALFIGIESQHWTIQDFHIAAQEVKALGVWALIIKIADGANEWYSGLGGWRAVLEAVKEQGIQALPYLYSYGNTFAALSKEIAILMEAMDTVGMVIADMEMEWNGQTSWAQTLANALKEKPGLFGITTWADPQVQNWQGVMQALKPIVDCWLPQVYTDFLAGLYKEQYAGLPVLPVLSLGEDFGPNDVVQHAQQAQSPAIVLWEYQQATGGSQQEVKKIVAMKTPATTPTANQLKAANDCWGSVFWSVKQQAPQTGTGIYKAWLDAYVQGKFYGPAITDEYQSVDWNGNAITVQEFARARCEWSNGVPHWYSINGKM